VEEDAKWMDTVFFPNEEKTWQLSVTQSRGTSTQQMTYFTSTFYTYPFQQQLRPCKAKKGFRCFRRFHEEITCKKVAGAMHGIRPMKRVKIF
jgi:hypothetical protein